jgi:mutator protein MutT
MIFKKRPEDFDKKIDVAGVFVEHEGQFILLHRQDHKPQGNTWGAPAGKVEVGETPTEAMVREIKEEVGLCIKDTDLKFIDTYYVRHEGRDILYHQFHLILKVKPEIKHSPKEHKDFMWVKPVDALKMDLIHDEDMCIKWVYGME